MTDTVGGNMGANWITNPMKNWEGREDIDAHTISV
jgi:hypothetical protein